MKRIITFFILLHFSEMVIFAKYRDLPFPDSFYLNRKPSKIHNIHFLRKTKNTKSNQEIFIKELPKKRGLLQKQKKVNNVKEIDFSTINDLVLKKIKYKKIDFKKKRTIN